MIIDKYKFIHLGAGDLLRAEIKRGTEQGKKIKEIIDTGSIVPVKITCGLIKQEMEKQGKDKIYLIDGYPRNQDNIDGWKEIFGDTYKLICTINLEAPEEELTKRLIERSKNSGRSDDNIEVIKKRFKTHRECSAPIIPEVKKMGPYIEVYAMNDKITVFNNIVIELDKKIKEAGI